MIDDIHVEGILPLSTILKIWMEVEEITPKKELTRQEVNSYGKETSRNELLDSTRRVEGFHRESFTKIRKKDTSRRNELNSNEQDRYTQSGREVPHTITEVYEMLVD